MRGRDARNHKWHTKFLRQGTKCGALRALEEAGVDDDRVACAGDTAGVSRQLLVGSRRRVRCVDASADGGGGMRECVEAVHPLAFDIRAYAYGAERGERRLRERGLAGAGQAMRDNDRAAPGVGIQHSKREIAPKGLKRALTLLACCAALAATYQADFRAHHGAINKIERQHRDAGVVAAVLEVSVEEHVSKIAAAVRFKIHYQERHLADGVHPAQSGVELDAIERRRLAVDQRDVAEMEVAMAFAHTAGDAAPCKLVSVCPVLTQGPVAHSSERGDIGRRIEQRQYLPEVVKYRRQRRG